MEMKKYEPTKEHLKNLEELKTAFKEDIKFAYALHSSILAKKMRSWGYMALKYLPKKSDGLDWNWMEGYPCGDYEDLLFNTISLHYPNIFEKIRKDIPYGYIYNFVLENLYPLSITK